MGKRGKTGSGAAVPGQVRLGCVGDPLKFGRFDSEPYSQLVGECYASGTSRILKWLDPCNNVWLPQEQDIVSANVGCTTGIVPTMVFLSTLNVLENAAIKPLKRLLGYKGMRCKKQNKKENPDDSNGSDSDGDAESEPDDKSELGGPDDDVHGGEEGWPSSSDDDSDSDDDDSDDDDSDDDSDSDDDDSDSDDDDSDSDDD